MPRARIKVDETIFLEWSNDRLGRSSSRVENQRRSPSGLRRHSGQVKCHTRSRSGTSAASQTSFWQKQTSSGPCTNACFCVRIRKQNLPFSVRVLASAESITSPECMVARFSIEKRPPKPLKKLGKGHSKGSSQFSPRTARSKPRSAPANQVLGSKRSGDVARPPHLGALIAAKPRILDTIRGAATAILLPEQPLLRSWTHKLRLPPPSSSTTLTTLRNPPLNCTCKRKTAQAADEAWQQPVQGHNGPTITNPTIPDVEQSGLTSQHDDDFSHLEEDDSVHHSSKHNFPDCQTDPDCGA